MPILYPSKRRSSHTIFLIWFYCIHSKFSKLNFNFITTHITYIFWAWTKYFGSWGWGNRQWAYCKNSVNESRWVGVIKENGEEEQEGHRSLSHFTAVTSHPEIFLYLDFLLEPVKGDLSLIGRESIDKQRSPKTRLLKICSRSSKK